MEAVSNACTKAFSRIRHSTTMKPPRTHMPCNPCRACATAIGNVNSLIFWLDNLRSIGSKKVASFLNIDRIEDLPFYPREQPDISAEHFNIDMIKRIETCSILSIFKVKFDFKIVAPFYPLPYRTRSGSILFPRKGYGYYMRDHVLAAMDFCKKFKIDAANALDIEEANWFHASAEAERNLKEGHGPFVPVARAFLKRIEFDQKDPAAPNNSRSKTSSMHCTASLPNASIVEAKTARRSFRRTYRLGTRRRSRRTRSASL